MDKPDKHMDDIPLLEDMINDALDEQSGNKDNPSHIKKENPFLPYEHLARLAREREQFSKSLASFTDNLKQDRPYSRYNTSSSGLSTNTSYVTSGQNNDAIVQAITRKVLNQLKPIIEDKVAAELAAHFKDTSTDAK